MLTNEETSIYFQCYVHLEKIAYRDRNDEMDGMMEERKWTCSRLSVNQFFLFVAIYNVHVQMHTHMHTQTRKSKYSCCWV